jgi:glycosyltransferase involved in cell wall biosynthesis
VKVTLLIPIFDHGATIGSVVASLAHFGLPCLIVDDGSGPETRQVLDELEVHCDFVSVHRRKRNGGRGAALKSGYRTAAAQGYTHAIQLDADGQHCADDVPAFLDAIASQPEALVLGAPQFDESAPRARLYGRQLSRGLVWLTTLSFAVEDPLCGSRAIPLAPTCALLEARALGDHMEFDPELVIALVRRGVPVTNLPTRVVYAEGGLSHFDMLHDNLRLSSVYARALAGLPSLLLRRGREDAR